MSEPVRNNFSGGEIDPAKGERFDLKKWRNCLDLAMNVVLDDGGGVRQRPALAHKARLRRRLARYDLTADMVTVPAGADVDLLIDDGEMAVSPLTASVVVAQIDLGAPLPVMAVDVLGFKAGVASEGGSDSGGGDGTRSFTDTTRFTNRASTDDTEQTYASLTSLSEERRGRGIVQPSPEDEEEEENIVEGALLHVEVLVGTTWVDLSPGQQVSGSYRSRRFAAAGDVTARHLRIRLADCEAQASFMLREIAVWSETAELSAVQLIPTGDFLLALTDMHGDIFAAGERKASVPLHVDGDIVPEVTDASALATTLLFHNALPPLRLKQHQAGEWNVDHPAFENVPELSPASALSGTTGPMFSADNGWPGCGAFTQARLWLSGFPSAPLTYIFSRLGHPFDFQQDYGTEDEPEVTMDAGIEDTINAAEDEKIRRLHVGRDLQIFTDKGEWYISSRTLDATQPRNVVSSTRYGIDAMARLVSADGGTLFAPKGGGALRDMFFSDIEQSYSAEPATIWGAHLIGTVAALARRRAFAGTSAERVVSINTDGSGVTVTTLRKQEIFGMARLVTDGRLKAAAVDGANRLFVVVEREIGGQADHWLEMWDASRLLDASVVVSLAAGENVVTGLDRLEGKSVWAIVDGTPEGPFTVSGGSITVSEDDVPRTVEVGLDYDVRIRDLPLRRLRQNGEEDDSPRRLHTLTLSLEATGPLMVRVGGFMPGYGRRKLTWGPWRDVQTDNFDEVNLDTPLMSRLYSGEVTVGNIRGFYRKPMVEICRAVPCPVFIKSSAKEFA